MESNISHCNHYVGILRIRFLGELLEPHTFTCYELYKKCFLLLRFFRHIVSIYGFWGLGGKSFAEGLQV